MARQPDLVAYTPATEVRVFGTVTASTATAIYNAITTAMSSSGWGTVGASNTWLSKQSPWWDDTATPPGTYQGYIKLILTTSGTNIFFRALSSNGSYDQGTDSSVQLKANGDVYNFLTNPYQVIAWDPTQGTVASFSSLIASAFNTPKWQQVDNHEKESLVCFGADVLRAARLDNGNGLSDSFWLVVDDTGTFSTVGQINAMFAVPGGGNANSASAAAYVVDWVNDPTMTSTASWFPMVAPAHFGWGTAAGAVSLYGWLWDSVIVNRGLTQDGTFNTPDGHKFIAFSGSNTLGALCFAIS